MSIEYLAGSNMAILYPDYLKSKTLPENLKQILFKEIQDGLKHEREDDHAS